MPSNTKIEFKVVKSRGPNSNGPRICYIIRDNWDDFSFKTTCHLYYTDNNIQVKSLGIVKIMQAGITSGYTTLDDSFTQLPSTHCSLGNQGYYEEIVDLPEEIRLDILRSLRDCVYHPEIFSKNLSESAMKNSLLRDISLSNVNRLYPSILAGNAFLTPFQFKFLINGDEDSSIEVSVSPHSLPPTNIHVLIGRNGVGKTRILSGLMDEITKNKSPNNISQKGTLQFPSEDMVTEAFKTEKFTNLIVVVFSAFDNFKPVRNLTEKGSIPCQYIGLKNEDGNAFKTPTELKQDFTLSIDACLGTIRKKRWIDAIKILNSDPIFKEYNMDILAEKGAEMQEFYDIFDDLSSGHKIILLTLTRLVELVDEKTLILIDEPENHLHPPLLSSFIRAISNLSIQRNAVALVATHSPVVLQEVPRSCVTKIYRVGNSYNLHRPEFETYAENIDTLTRDVFMLELEDSGFYKSIKKHLEAIQFDYDSLMNDFQDSIGSEGRALAISLIAQKNNSNE